MSDLPISFEDVVAAARRIEGVAHRTPVLTSSTADALTRAKLFFKAETLQRMGAFKFRGGYNSLAQFTPEQKAGGVIAYSSGNHAQAIALSAKLLDMRAVIIMPEDAPAIKIAATRGYGAEVVLYDRYSEDREEIGNRLAAEQGLTLIPPYDHPHVMAGQGTAVLEMFEQVGAPDLLLVPVGGGGLMSGSAVVARQLAPDCRIVGIEPEAGEVEILNSLDYAIYFLAYRLYRARPLAAPSTLFFPEETPPVRQSWVRRASKRASVNVVILPGDHHTCITKYTPALVEKLQQAMGAAKS